MKPFKPTSILLLALALAACDSNDLAPDGQLLPITTGTAGIETTTRAELPPLEHVGGPIYLYTPDNGKTCNYNLSSTNNLTLANNQTPPVGRIGNKLTAHAYGYVDTTDPTLTNVFVHTTATNHSVTKGAKADEAGITLTLAPAAARIRIKVVGGYGESEAENAALVPNVTLNPAIFEQAGNWAPIQNPGQDFPAKLTAHHNPVASFRGSSPQLMPGTIVANAASHMLTLYFEPTDPSLYAGFTYTVLMPQAGITLEAGCTYVYTIALKSGTLLAKIANREIEDFEKQGSTEWNLQ